MNDPLLPELRAILESCKRERVPVFVIGAFSVHAYVSLIRTSKDLDFAVASGHWPALKAVLDWYDLLEGVLSDDDRLSALETARLLLKARP